MITHIRIATLVVCSVAFCCCNKLSAQTSRDTAAPTGNASAGQPPAAAPNTADAAKKAQILASERWKKVTQEFQEWLSAQVVYTPQQVERMKAKLASQVQQMSAAELQQLLDQWDAKLKVLLSPDAAEVREWLGQYLSVIADGYRPTFLKKLGITDVSKLTAAQIEEELDHIRAERLAFQQQQTFFNTSREAMINNANQIRAASLPSLQEAGQGTAAEMGTYQTQFAPRQYNYQPLPPIIPFVW
jgi:hypothetical protein